VVESEKREEQKKIVEGKRQEKEEEIHNQKPWVGACGIVGIALRCVDARRRARRMPKGWVPPMVVYNRISRRIVFASCWYCQPSPPMRRNWIP
jgi:hypothetical protein